MDRTLQAQLEQDPLLLTATEWLFELRSNDVPMERIAEWQRWLAADVGNQRAFERVESFWRASSQAVTTRWPTDDDIENDGYDGEVSVSEWRQQAAEVAKRGPYSNRARWALAASSASLVVLLGWVAFKNGSPVQTLLGAQPLTINVSTGIGESRTLPLPDGSSVSVGGRTEVRASLDESLREITLEEGEAFFHVAKDKSRPFTVRAGQAAVTAIGTAFNVRKSGAQVVVAVSEGVVRVVSREARPKGTGAAPAVQLEAGQQLVIGSSSKPAHVLPVDVNAVAGWRQGRLQYQNEALETIVADLARYSTHDIQIADRDAAAIRITGIVFERNIDGWLNSLQATFPVRVVRDSSGRVTLESVR